MPKVTISTKPSSAAAGGNGFNQAAGRAGVDASAAGSSSNSASDSVRTLGTAARSAAQALERFTAALGSATGALSSGRSSGVGSPIRTSDSGYAPPLADRHVEGAVARQRAMAANMRTLESVSATASAGTGSRRSSNSPDQVLARLSVEGMLNGNSSAPSAAMRQQLMSGAPSAFQQRLDASALARGGQGSFRPAVAGASSRIISFRRAPQSLDEYFAQQSANPPNLLGTLGGVRGPSSPAFDAASAVRQRPAQSLDEYFSQLEPFQRQRGMFRPAGGRGETSSIAAHERQTARDSAADQKRQAVADKAQQKQQQRDDARAWANTWRDAHEDNRAFDRGVRDRARAQSSQDAAMYRYMRQNADHENRMYDRRRSRITNGIRGGAARFLNHAGRFAGMGALGEIGGLAGMMLDNPVTAGLAVASTVAFLPQLSAGLNSGFMGATSDYRNTATGMYALSRAGGWNGDAMMDSFTNPSGSHFNRGVRSAFSQVGLDPQSAVRLVQQYGITPQSQNDFLSTAVQLQATQLNPTLGNVSQGQLMSTLGFMRSSGAGGNLAYNTQNLTNLLSDAMRLGIDKSTLIQSMTSSLSTAIQGGALGANANTESDFVKQFTYSGTASGRTGASAAALAGGTTSAMNNVFGSPARAAMMMQAAGRIRNASDLANVIGPDAYQQLSHSPAGQMEIQQMLSAPPAIKAQLLGNIMAASPDASINMMTNFATNTLGLRGAEVQSFVASQTGTTLGAVYDYRGGQQAQSGYMANQDDQYTAQMRQMGVPASQIATFLAAGKKNNVNPVVLASQAKTESAFGKNNYNAASGARGEMQFLPSTWKQYGGGNINNNTDSINAAARYDRALLDRYGGNLSRALNTYGGDTSGQYAQTIFGNMPGGANQVVPVSADQQKILNAQSRAGYSGIQGSEDSFYEFNGAVSTFSTAVDEFSTAMKSLGKWLSQPIATRGNGTPHSATFMGFKV
jgi:hypothetical protein